MVPICCSINCRVLWVMMVSEENLLLNPPGSAVAAGVQGQQEQLRADGLSSFQARGGGLLLLGTAKPKCIFQTGCAREF